MVTGISLHIGLNYVDPAHYQDQNGNPWDGLLHGCEFDARDMQALAQGRGFQTRLLLNEQASAAMVINAISQTAQQLQSGDLFLLTYSGHGGQVPDRNGSDEEEDHFDETWCLYDRQLIDDELYALWAKFQPGVRILMLSDSCHSGSVAKDPNFSRILLESGVSLRLLPDDVRDGTYKTSQELYDAIQTENLAGEQIDIKASVILISGCQDNQLSNDGPRNGLFTATLLKVWKNGKYKSSITRFWKSIINRMPLYQSPNLFKVGVANPTFERQPPFTI